MSNIKFVAKLPAPSRWLNYRGDHRGSIGKPMGPNTLNEVFTVVAAEYDPDAKTSRLGLAYGLYVVGEEP